ncbi:MAG: hypothetical protein GTO55_07840 [Armatimonadetes bacterium]|nr:hypothetical protein [Armatimonadota bacterium]NIM24175.1 hypothetical protein [Armatimonadota bacterium]NIM68034.1 hypothetical protein [Armatimonadota bacterium]NIM76529.1 hypothetical protein [Armatimonadota bacterium]NIN06268.1 hypothetical protein [Armatimonadota bacterium]
MSRVVLIEWIIIIVGLISIWPIIAGYHAIWYSIYLFVVMLALIWVTRSRLRRIRQAADESRRKQEEIERTGPKPMF